jgi:hypothetical protein
MANGPKKQIAIVGGGCAAMAAAWDLTHDDACEVTIFQIGGRLGGKGASSCNAAYGHRIEEHGLHLWLGYYENAFRLVRTCFDELRRTDIDKVNDPELAEMLALRPFDNWNWQTAFERARLVGLADDSTGDWLPWIARFPEYVHESEEGVTGIYRDANGMPLPGVHIVKDRRRAYPGEPVPLAVEQCPPGEDEGAGQRLDVAYFLTHALRELQAFAESLELRLSNPANAIDAPPDTENLDVLLADALGPDIPSGRSRSDADPVDVPARCGRCA